MDAVLLRTRFCCRTAFCIRLRVLIKFIIIFGCYIVLGACESDYGPDEEIPSTQENPVINVETSETADEHKESKDKDSKDNESNEDGNKEEKESEDAGIGKITFVSCATGSEGTNTLPPAAKPNETPPETIPTEPIDTNANGEHFFLIQPSNRRDV